MAIENAKLVPVPIKKISKERVLELIDMACEEAVILAVAALDREGISFEIPVIIESHRLFDDDVDEDELYRYDAPKNSEIEEMLRLSNFNDECNSRLDVTVESESDTDWAEWYITFKSKPTNFLTNKNNTDFH